jgi:cytochrome c-type biogenesis protein CcmH
MRAVIRDQVKAGKTPEQVRGYFIEKYGEWILLEPKPKGLNLVVYALPVLAVLGGLMVVLGAVRKWTATTAAEPTHTDPVPPAVPFPDK